MLPSSISKQGQLTLPAAGVYIGLGSNLGFGDMLPREILTQALATIGRGGDKIIAASSFWVSNAWPPESLGPEFVNLVCQIQPFDNVPRNLLERLHAIEAKFGRHRDTNDRWLARSLDLDLLDYNGQITKNCSFVTLPHERLAERDFVLRPLLELNSDWTHPVTSISAWQSLAALETSGLTNGCHLDVAAEPEIDQTQY